MQTKRDETRLDSFLANHGFASRRKIGDFLKANHVTIDGTRLFEPGFRLDPSKQTVFINGKPIQKPKLVYFMGHKPLGILSTVSDDRGRKTVTSLVSANERLYPIGRLDKDSTGLLLLTNDGALAYRLTHPRFHVQKTYEVLVIGSVTETKLQKLRQGIQLDDGITAPAQVAVLHQYPDKTLLEFVLHEGKKRQIRRMCAALRLHVAALKRVAFGTLTLGNLKLGSFRILTPHEIQQFSA